MKKTYLSESEVGLRLLFPPVRKIFRPIPHWPNDFDCLYPVSLHRIEIDSLLSKMKELGPAGSLFCLIF